MTLTVGYIAKAFSSILHIEGNSQLGGVTDQRQELSTLSCSERFPKKLSSISLKVRQSAIKKTVKADALCDDGRSKQSSVNKPKKMLISFGRMRVYTNYAISKHFCAIMRRNRRYQEKLCPQLKLRIITNINLV